MSRRNLLNLVLLLIVAALVLITVYEPGKDKPETVSLTSVDKTDVNRIRIKRRQADAIDLRKVDDQWQMQSPYQLPASDFKVNELLQLLDATSYAQRDLAQLDKSKFGLDVVDASIRFNDGEPLEFGSTDPLNNRRYVSYRGTLHLITDTFYYQLGRAATDFLDNALVAGKAPITALLLPDIKLRRAEAGWTVEPAQQNVSQDRINELLDNWQYAQALAIGPWQAQDTPHAERIHIERAAAPAIEFIVVSRKPKFILARPDKGVQYELAEDQYRNLMQLPPEVEAPEGSSASDAADAAVTE